MKKVAIRFGHQTTGADGGAVGYVKETDVNRRYGDLVINKLKALSYDVLNVTPPEANRNLADSLNYGINMANNWGAELFVSCHVNANVTTSQPMGCEVVCSGSGAGLTYATKISNELANLGFKNRGAKGDERGLAEIRGTNMPCVICEPFFLDSKFDVDLYNKVGDEGIANAIVKAITGQSVSGGNTSSPSTNNTPRLLKLTSPMMQGQDITDLQNKLNKLGCNITVDGYFGKESDSAVKLIQNKLGIECDGVVGNQTILAINNAIGKLNQPQNINSNNQEVKKMEEQYPTIDHTIPDNPYITLKLPNGLGYIESIPEKGRLIIHLDKYNYISIQDDEKEGNNVWITTRTKGTKNLI